MLSSARSMAKDSSDHPATVDRARERIGQRRMARDSDSGTNGGEIRPARTCFRSRLKLHDTYDDTTNSSDPGSDPPRSCVPEWCADSPPRRIPPQRKSPPLDSGTACPVPPATVGGRPKRKHGRGRWSVHALVRGGREALHTPSKPPFAQQRTGAGGFELPGAEFVSRPVRCCPALPRAG